MRMQASCVPGAIIAPAAPMSPKAQFSLKLVANRLEAALIALTDRWLETSERRRSLAALASLDDRLLRDIGIAPGSREQALGTRGPNHNPKESATHDN